MDELNFLLNVDVLGFSEFVKSNTIKDVFNYYAQIITGSAFSAEIIENNKNDIEVMVYSDTIAIKSNDNDKLRCFVQLVRIASMIQHGQYYKSLNSLDPFLPIRGTITFGAFVFHKGDIWTQALTRPKVHANNINMIFGEAIIDAYRFEKEMEIIGIALEDSVVAQSNNKNVKKILDVLVDSNLLVEYDIPLKRGEEKKGFLVNPTIWAHCDHNLERLEKEKSKFKEGTSEYEKYSNTIKFFKHIKDNDLFHPPRPE